MRCISMVRFGAALAAAAALAAPTMADVTVTGDGGAAISSATFDVQFSNGEWFVTILDRHATPPAQNIFEVRADDDDDIASIIVDVTTLGEPIILRVIPDDFGAGVGSVGLIAPSFENEAEIILIRVETNRDLGNITADAIEEIIVGGDVTGDIFVRANSPPMGNLDFLDVPEGAILGEVTAVIGRIERINAAAIGTPTSSALIFAGTGVGRIDVDGDAYAFINTRLASSVEPLGGIAVFIADRFEGTLLTARVDIDPVLEEGLLWFSDGFDGLIAIDESLIDIPLDPQNPQIEQEPRSILLSTVGLNGQIIINAAGDVDGSNDPLNEWDAPVHVGTTTIEESGYTNTHTSLGGGSVGRAPFELHDQSCAPGNNSVIEDTPSTQSVRLHHYGPIQYDSQETPVKVSRRLTGTQDSFVDVTSSFNFAVNSADDRRLDVVEKFSHSFEEGYTYKIEPESDLECELVSGNPPVAHYEYFISVIEWDCGCLCSTDPECEDLEFGMLGAGPDFNGDGYVDEDDLEILMAAMDLPGGRADMNRDRIVNSADLAILMNAWGEYPPRE